MLVFLQHLGRTALHLGQADAHAQRDVPAVVEQHEQHVVRMVGEGGAADRRQRRPLPPPRPPVPNNEGLF